MKDIVELHEYLPHRYPFLLVDRVETLVVGDRIEGYKNVTANEDFFNGHFPGRPIMPGVLIVEAMAQLSGVLAFETKGLRPRDGYTYFLAAADNTRFKRPVVPGDRLAMTSVIVANRATLLKFDCKAYVDEELACQSTITVMQRRT